MEVELFTEEMSEDENYVLDDKIEDYLDVEGERCGICMEIVVDRGVLDCCQHWFCFECIDNWATITSLCPLCQNEFQLITCLPVYDTVGGNKTDEDTTPRDEDWFIEGNSNSLSFPAYYIDENAVVCLDGDGCKIRSASVAIEEDSDVDTSIACDSCDKWYHAFCVGFDPDGTCDSSWLCPRCLVDKVPLKLDQYSLSLLLQSHQNGLLGASGGSRVGDSLPEKVTVSIADVGETAVVVSLVEEHQKSRASRESALGCSENMKLKNTLSSSSTLPESEPLLDARNSTKQNSGQQEVGLSSSQKSNNSSSDSISTAQQNIYADDGDDRVTEHSNSKSVDPRSCFDLGLPVRSIHSVDAKDDEEVKDQEAEFMKPNISSEESSLTADKMVLDNMKVISLNSMISVEKKTSISSAGAKRKHRKIRNADDGEQEADTEAKFSQKKIKAERNSQTKKDQALKYVLEEPRPVSRRSISMDSKLKGVPEHENGPTDIMDLVRGTERRSLEQQQNKRSSVVPPGERETASGLRLKKIMRRAGDDKDSSVLVQELRKKIREAVRNKSSKEAGQNLFDPKLLDAFRAALAGSGTENRKPALDVKAKKSMLQKGKVRESLTRKIYGAGGKRKRAWTRECEVEFWKHRCHKTSKPEKIQTLKSVLDLLRDDSDKGKKVPKNEEEQTGSVLSRLYLADTSVFPRKNDIVPVSALNAVATPEHKGEGTLKEKISESSHIDHPVRIPAKNISVTQVIVPPIYSKGMRKSAKDLRVTSQKEPVSKPDITKGDKRKWALELLARKTAIPGKNGHENEEDNAIPKGNYPLLAHLPKDMRPVLAPSRHNKIPMSVRQAQLYRLTEHFLRKANLSEVCKTAETELAVADAVNIEKGLADRSNSKLVYVNLCSQELLRRSDNMISDRSKESNECSTSEELVDRVSEDANNSSLDLTVDEALKNAGLMSDSPPNSPNHPIEDNNHEAVLAENNEEEGPDNILEVDSHPELDIYGDFEYDLEDDDLIGTGSLKISKQPEDQKIKLVFSSLTLEKSDGALEPLVHEGMRNAEAFSGSSVLLESEHMTVDGDLTVNRKMDECLVQSSVGDGDEELSLAECEELYGPDREPIHVQYPETDLTTTGENTINHGLTGENGDNESKPLENDSAFDSNCSISKESPMNVQKTDNAKKEKMSKSDSKRLENYDAVVKKVEAYIKEHIRPLCKSGVITVEQYRWSVGKTTEKVMKYHSKEKNANFLIKEGEKVKKLAEQYVEAAPQKAKN